MRRMGTQEEKEKNARYVPCSLTSLPVNGRGAGFARRYFVLDQSGSLSYSIDPKRPIRDQIFLPHAALSTAVGRKDIHVDSSNATFHIKCLTADDYNTWLTAIR